MIEGGDPLENLQTLSIISPFTCDNQKSVRTFIQISSVIYMLSHAELLL